MVPMSPTTSNEFAEAFPPLFGFTGLDVSVIAPVVLLLAFGVWALFTSVITYHWFRYAHNSWVAVPALATHVGVSIVLLLYSLSGLA
jgi:hypothetical protein